MRPSSNFTQHPQNTSLDSKENRSLLARSMDKKYQKVTSYSSWLMARSMDKKLPVTVLDWWPVQWKYQKVTSSSSWLMARSMDKKLQVTFLVDMYPDNLCGSWGPTLPTGGWGPVLPNLFRSSRLRSGGAHCDCERAKRRGGEEEAGGGDYSKSK